MIGDKRLTETSRGHIWRGHAQTHSRDFTFLINFGQNVSAFSVDEDSWFLHGATVQDPQVVPQMSAGSSRRYPAGMMDHSRSVAPGDIINMATAAATGKN